MKKHISTISLLVLFFGLPIYGQETTLQLPTDDNTSSFNVTKNNGTSVFKVDGSGCMSGDGSGLANTKSVVNYLQGNQYVRFHEGAIPGLNLYEAQVMREVTISCPGPGVIWAHYGGYLDWESVNEDLARIWFWPHPTVSPISDWQTPDFHNLQIVSDYQCADSSDQYTSWSISKVYTVSGAGDFTVKVCGDKPFTSSKLLICDICLYLLYIPTGGTGPSGALFASSQAPEEIYPDTPTGNTIDGLQPYNEQEEKPTNETARITKLENEIDELKQKINLLLEARN